MDETQLQRFTQKLVSMEAEERGMARAGNSIGSSFWRGAAYGLRDVIRDLYGQATTDEIVRRTISEQVAAEKAAVPS